MEILPLLVFMISFLILLIAVKNYKKQQSLNRLQKLQIEKNVQHLENKLPKKTAKNKDSGKKKSKNRKKR
jgi:amino acid permease